jgi:hypothetical protein
MFGLEPNTSNDTDSHVLPPDPVDEVKSTIKSSHDPIALAIDIITTGAFTTDGANIVTFWGSFELQLEQEGFPFEVHRALNNPFFKTHTLPTRNEGAEDLSEEISREVSLVHTQRNEEGEGVVKGGEGDGGEDRIEKKTPQFEDPAPLVGKVNVTVTLLPSEENSDRSTNGAGEASPAPFTTSKFPAGNTA